MWLLMFAILFIAEYIDAKKYRANNEALVSIPNLLTESINTDFTSNIQDFLRRIKKPLKERVELIIKRRNTGTKRDLEDFLRSIIGVLLSYENNDLENFAEIFDMEFRKYRYKGCKFYEIVRIPLIKTFFDKNLNNLKTMSTEVKRTYLSFLYMLIKNNTMINYLNRFYVNHTEALSNFLRNLELYRNSETRKDLAVIIRTGIRSIVFDPYSRLDTNSRRSFALRLALYLKKHGNWKPDFRASARSKEQLSKERRHRSHRIHQHALKDTKPRGAEKHKSFNQLEKRRPRKKLKHSHKGSNDKLRKTYIEVSEEKSTLSIEVTPMVGNHIGAATKRKKYKKHKQVTSNVFSATTDEHEASTQKRPKKKQTFKFFEFGANAEMKKVSDFPKSEESLDVKTATHSFMGIEKPVGLLVDTEHKSKFEQNKHLFRKEKSHSQHKSRSWANLSGDCSEDSEPSNKVIIFDNIPTAKSIKTKNKIKNETDFQETKIFKRKKVHKSKSGWISPGTHTGGGVSKKQKRPVSERGYKNLEKHFRELTNQAKLAKKGNAGDNEKSESDIHELIEFQSRHYKFPDGVSKKKTNTGSDSEYKKIEKNDRELTNLHKLIEFQSRHYKLPAAKDKIKKKNRLLDNQHDIVKKSNGKSNSHKIIKNKEYKKAGNFKITEHENGKKPVSGSGSGSDSKETQNNKESIKPINDEEIAKPDAIKNKGAASQRDADLKNKTNVGKNKVQIVNTISKEFGYQKTGDSKNLEYEINTDSQEVENVNNEQSIEREESVAAEDTINASNDEITSEELLDATNEIIDDVVHILSEINTKNHEEIAIINNQAKKKSAENEDTMKLKIDHRRGIPLNNKSKKTNNVTRKNAIKISVAPRYKIDQKIINRVNTLESEVNQVRNNLEQLEIYDFQAKLNAQTANKKLIKSTSNEFYDDESKSNKDFEFHHSAKSATNPNFFDTMEDERLKLKFDAPSELYNTSNASDEKTKETFEDDFRRTTVNENLYLPTVVSDTSVKVHKDSYSQARNVTAITDSSVELANAQFLNDETFRAQEEIENYFAIESGDITKAPNQRNDVHLKQNNERLKVINLAKDSGDTSIVTDGSRSEDSSSVETISLRAIIS